MGSYFTKYKITFIYILSLIVVAGFSIILIFTTKDNNNNHKQYKYKKRSNNNSTEIKNEGLIVLKTDKELSKPNVKMNVEFELVKMANNMTGVLISDPYATLFRLQVMLNYGYIIDTIPGLSHFGEHMMYEGSEKYSYYYPIEKFFSGIRRFYSNAMTGLNIQIYYISLPYNYLMDKAFDVFIDGFRYPLFLPDIIKNEIEAVNNEFYDIKNTYWFGDDIIRQLSSNNTSFNGFGCGNNETLKTNETESLSKKLKGYHMLIKNPNNLFFILYSNKTINESEEYALKYLNYTIHEFSEDEIDVEHQKKLKENINNIQNKEIFDEKLYKHGFYYNTMDQINQLSIYFYTGEFDSNELKFDIVDYYNYLFNSKSLLQILKSKNYIAMDVGILVERYPYLYLKNNDYFYVSTILTEEGLKEINDVLLIINNYIKIMKEEGYKQEYYNNFVHYMNNQNILGFNKRAIISFNHFIKMLGYNTIFGADKILLGKLSEEDYNEKILKNHLNNIKYEKSFYRVNSMNNIFELDFLDEVLKSKETKTLKYYNRDFIIGLIPGDLEEKINDNSYKIDNLKIREINSYFSKKYNEEVIPCYKEQNNTCKKKNEFDYEKEDKYSSIKLEEDNKYYQTYYQIDKSSESHLVYSHLEINLNQISNLNNEGLYISAIKTYLDYIKNEFYEIEETIKPSLSGLKLTFDFKTFSDNTEKIINDFIDILIKTPEEEDIEYIKLIMITLLNEEKSINLYSYVNSIFQKFITKGGSENLDESIKQVENLDNTKFQDIYSSIFKNINSINFKIAGNINKNLVQNIHNHLKEKFVINPNNIMSKQNLLKNSEEYYVINYYQKTTLNEPPNGISVYFHVSDYYSNYIEIFAKCFGIIAHQYLRFNYTNTYTLQITYSGGYFVIYEQGVFKEVDKMEDDINKVLLDTIEGKISINNYKEIRESYLFQVENKEEKNFDTLFNKFISEQIDVNDIKSQNTDITSKLFTKKKINIEEEEKNTEKEEKEEASFTIPENFSELVKIITPVFTKPKRIAILISGNYVSNENFKEMYERRKKIKEYALNNNIEIIHTDDINYSFDF